MKKVLVGILIVLLIMGAAIGYSINNKMKNKDIDSYNNSYEDYLNIDIRGATLLSLMNRVIDQNEKNNIEKNADGEYIENDTDSLKVYIKFVDRENMFSFEKINSVGMDMFAQNFSVSLFRCIKIDYHESTKQISRMYFEEVEDFVNTSN